MLTDRNPRSALDPGQINAYIQKGYAVSRKAKYGVFPGEAWKDIRSLWVKANKLENDNPIPLVQYYLTYLDQGVAPTQTSVAGLEWAMTLAPFNSSIRWMVSPQIIRDERLPDAARTLTSLAYSPHPGNQTDSAIQLLRDSESRMTAGQT